VTAILRVERHQLNVHWPGEIFPHHCARCVTDNRFGYYKDNKKISAELSALGGWLGGVIVLVISGSFIRYCVEGWL
jgi:hypothetical protein